MKSILKLTVIAACLLAALTAHADPPGDILKSRLVAPANPLEYFSTLQKATKLYQNGMYAEAERLYRSALDSYSLDGGVWESLGYASRRVGKHKEAVEAFQKALDLRSGGQPQFIHYYMAGEQLAAGDKEGAYKSLEKMLLDEQYTQKPNLYDDKAFASIQKEPRFQKLVGHIDTSKMSRTEGWRTDIDYLVSEIKRVNHKYRVEPLPAETLKRYQQLKRDVPKLTDDEIYAGMGRMLEPLGQGHMSLALMPETKLSAVRTLPLQFYAFPEGVFIVGADKAHEALIGKQVKAIEGVTPEKLLQMVEEHTSHENGMKVLWGATGNLGTIQILRGLGVVKPGKDEARLTLTDKDGTTSDVTVASVAGPQNRKLIPPPTVTPPLFLKDVPRAHWLEELPDHDAVFVQLNQVSPDPGETMAQFGLKLRKFLNEHPVKNVILDVRHNNGGNTGSYTEFLRTLVAHSVKDGNQLYVIIGRGVYSATGNLITDLERLARPVFVGESSSGFGNQDGDESITVLPYSGIWGFLTSVWWQYSHPWDKRTSMVPDVPVQLTAKAYFAGEDPVLQTTLDLIKQVKTP